jgi:membrane-bound metal-dependent hydrolase YbcI (DUF457 family)
MLGRSHAVSGAVAGLALPAALGMNVPNPLVVAGAAITAGAALLPDLDCDGGLATRSLGPVTKLIAEALEAVSVVVYRATRGRKDKHRDGAHRTLTHTLAFAAILGFSVAGLCSLPGEVGRWSTLGVLYLCLLLALRGLPPVNSHITDLFTAAALTALAWWLLPAVVNGVYLGSAMAAGCVVHLVGDAITEAGVPALWPIPLAGRTWRPLGIPRFLRFRAGGWFETVIVYPALLIAAIVLLINMTPIGHAAFAAAFK